MNQYDYETTLQELTAHPSLCATCKRWPPTQFIKVVKLDKISYPTPVKIDTALKTISIYQPKLSETNGNCWTINEGGETYGNFDKIRF